MYMAKSFYAFATMVLWLLTSNACIAGDALFVKALRNYNAKGPLGKVYRQELETRMFIHSAWRERLYVNLYDPSKDETLEIYSRPDGSRWLSFRRATPSLSQSILSRIWLGKQFDLKKELDQSSITAGEIELSQDVANQIELLWQTMLPGASKEPGFDRLYMHAPLFIAFANQNGSIKTGKMAFAAYHTPAYEEFVDIVNVLINACEHPTSKSTDLQRLSSKIRHLTARLNAK
jgi:hypothetical protein